MTKQERLQEYLFVRIAPRLKKKFLELSNSEGFDSYAMFVRVLITKALNEVKMNNSGRCNNFSKLNSWEVPN